MRRLKFGGWAISAVIFLLTISLALSAAMTVVDFYSGLDKDASDEGGEIAPPMPDTEGDNTDVENDTVIYLTNLSEALGPTYIEGLFTDVSDVDAEKLAELYAKLSALIPSVEKASGMTLSTGGVYNGESFVVVRSDISPDGDFSVGKETVSVAVKVDSSTDSSIKDGSVKIKYEDKEVDIKAIELYMGYIIKNSADGSSSLCDENGEVIIEDMGDRSPAYKRTSSGDPVFSDAAGAYYIIDKEVAGFVGVSADKIVSHLEYDYPYRPYKNENGETLYVKYDEKSKKYKFYNADTDKEVISVEYNEGYSFDQNGYALIRNKNGICYMVDSSEKIILKAYTGNYYHYPDKTVNQGYYVRSYYEMPYINNISAIGSGVVDEHGYVRVRLTLIGRSSAVYGKVVSDYETLTNVNTGEFFPIPEGYTLEGYSDGVLLLSKNGRYGYYSIEGKWIAQPIYSYAAPFVQGLAVVGYENGTLGMIDTSGNIVVPFVFSYISNVSSGLISVYSESGGWEIFKLYEGNA